MMEQTRLVFRHSSVARICILALSVSALVLSGCGSSFDSSPTSSPSQSSINIKGKLHGGQQPLNGASVYMYAVGTGGYGTASQLLTPTPVITDAAGEFNFNGAFSCTPGQTVYLYAKGGDPQISGPSNSNPNAAAGELAVVGQCQAGANPFPNVSFVWMDEVSTITTAYALAGFATDATDIASSATALARVGVSNAAANALNLSAQATGLALTTTPAGNGTVPASTINTLADILAGCINSSGPGSSGCSGLFSNARSGGSTGTAPTDTATAAINIAHNPTANVTTLYSLAQTSAPFMPTVSPAPADFTLSVNYTGGGLSTPFGIAIDKEGNVWAGGGAKNLTELSPLGAAISPSTGYTGGGIDGPLGVAIDNSGNVWNVNFNLLQFGGSGMSVSEFNSTGGAISGTNGYTGGGLFGPFAIAVDPSGNIWVTDSNTGGPGGTCQSSDGCVTELSSTGQPQSPSGGWGNLPFPEGIAFDGSGNMWIADNDQGAVSKYLSSGGSPATQTPLEFANIAGLSNGPTGVAVDNSGNIWVTSSGASQSQSGTGLSELSPAGAAISPSSGYTGGGLNVPVGIAVDGSGNIWIANSGANGIGTSVSEFNSAGTAVSSSKGFTGLNVSAPYGIAIDGSGNVWETNNGSGTVSQFIGAASPVVTPLVANLTTGTKKPAQKP